MHARESRIGKYRVARKHGIHTRAMRHWLCLRMPSVIAHAPFVYALITNKFTGNVFEDYPTSLRHIPAEGGGFNQRCIMKWSNKQYIYVSRNLPGELPAYIKLNLMSLYELISMTQSSRTEFVRTDSGVACMNVISVLDSGEGCANSHRGHTRTLSLSLFSLAFRHGICGWHEIDCTESS